MEKLTKITELTIEGITYIPKGSKVVLAERVDNLPFVLVRGYASGVQYGYLKTQDGSVVELINSRRIWSWKGATETNQIAVNGVNYKDSRITVVIPKKIITDVIETIYITSEAENNLKNQPVWKD